jgi:hypothetical protein
VGRACEKGRKMKNAKEKEDKGKGKVKRKNVGRSEKIY